MKTWFAIIVYILVICFIAFCTGIIVFKLLFLAPCTPTGPNGSVCTVDGWSIAGLAATVLGVAATVLAILGAFAVAYWWIKLDGRVNEQVTALFNAQKTTLNKEMHDLLEEQKTTLNKEVGDVLKEQKATIDKEVAELLKAQGLALNKEVDRLLVEQRKKIEAQEHQLDTLKSGLKREQELADSIIELTLSLATINPPWVLEEWAKDITDRFKTADAAKQMVLSYLNIVHRLLSPDLTHARQQLSEQHAPSTNLRYYWHKALDWQQVVEEHFKDIEGEVEFTPDGKSFSLKVPESLEVVREKMSEFRPKVEEWLKQHPQ